jgi:NADPH2:quinone reductase
VLASYVLDSGSPGSLRLGRLEAPTPGPGQVLVQVQAASLDRVDTYIRRGTHGMAVTGPTILGRDVAGTVVRTGPGVTGFTPGDAVVGLTTGTHAELAVVPATHCFPRPAALDAVHAAAVPTAGRTAYDAVVNLAGVRPGDRVLVVAAAGAVGTFAVQYAHHLGAHVVGTSAPAKADAVRALGALDAVDHYRPDVVDFLRAALPGGEADVIVESVGGTLWSDVLKVLAPGGRLVTCGVTADSHAHLHLGRLMVKGWTLRGIGRPGPEAVARQLYEALTLSAVTAAPAIAATHPLEQAAAAHEQLEASDFVGRIVLTTG